MLITFYCENCSKTWNRHYHFHKGSTYTIDVEGHEIRENEPDGDYNEREDDDEFFDPSLDTDS